MLLCVQQATVLGHQRLPVPSSLQTLRLNITGMKYFRGFACKKRVCFHGGIVEDG